MLTRKSLSRRTILRSAGAALGLPFLDAMLPALTPWASAAAKPRLRFGAIYFPNGAIMQEFTPRTVGNGFEFTPILKPLEPFRDSLVVVTNLTRSHPGSQVGDHAVSAAGFLTGVWPKRTEAEDVLANTTIDQIVARQIGQETSLPSLEVATEDFTGYVGGCSPGFSCAYLNTICWSTPSTPLPMETNPHVVFERCSALLARRSNAKRAWEKSGAFSIPSPKKLATSSAASDRVTGPGSAITCRTSAKSSGVSSRRRLTTARNWPPRRFQSAFPIRSKST